MKLARLAPLLLAAACAPAPTAPASPALHAVQNQRLHGLMDEVNSLMLSEKEMTEHQREVRRRGHYGQIAESAGALEKAVAAIQSTSPSLPLNAAEQATFAALATQLGGEARTLRLLAEGNRGDAIPAELERITVTCNACHHLFKAGGRWN